MRLDQEAIKLCYSTHRQQTVARINYAFDAEPYCATIIANILTEGCRLAGIKQEVILQMLRNFFVTNLPEQRGDLSYIQEYNSCSSPTNLDWSERASRCSGKRERNRLDI